VEANLEDRWMILGPDVKAYPTKEEEKSSPNACGTCSSPVAFQIEYIVSKDIKYAYYKVLQKDCTEEYEPGTEIVTGTGEAVQRNGDGNLYTMTLSNIVDTDNQLASVEFVPADTQAPSWWSNMMFWKTKPNRSDNILEFCIRMGLWLPPEAGDIEVNFRETNVLAAYTESPVLTESGEATSFRRVNIVVLDPRPMNNVTVTVFGKSAGNIEQPVCENEECDSSQEESGVDKKDESQAGTEEKDEL
jgi:hypothetical protein